MDPISAFAITFTVIFIAGVAFRISPFFTLTGGALLFGLLIGLSPDVLVAGITDGMGRVFGVFAMIILSGMVLSALLKEQGLIEVIIDDLSRLSARPGTLAAVSGYLLSVPLTCTITAYVLLIPVLSPLGRNPHHKTAILTLAAVSATVSYVLIFPSPVVAPVFAGMAQDLSPLTYLAVAIPLSALIVGACIIADRMKEGRDLTTAPLIRPHPIKPETTTNGISPRMRAWLPFFVMGAVMVCAFSSGVSHLIIIEVTPVSGMISALLLAPHAAWRPCTKEGVQRAGVILFDICGAGALGALIVEGGFSTAAYTSLAPVLPQVLIPFTLAAIIQTAQGSRITTAVVTTATLVSIPSLTAGISPLTTVLMVSAGTCLFSTVTDPFFWIICRTTGAPPLEVTLRYTIPLALAGLTILAAALSIQFFTI
ncbi:MAG: hypothetical protein NT074_07000 [Methanomicrobiales archaeon]|nr:hypothetical protein [Methanomicrobiales archaeon]